MRHDRPHVDHLRRGLATTLGVLALASSAVAQPIGAPAQGAAPAQPPAAAAQQATAPAPVESYSYDPEGRRDPFVSLLSRGADVTIDREVRPEGREGLAIGEVSVRGIVRTRNAFVAMLQGPDNKTYIIHTGDKMLDGAVKAITADSVVFAQDVNDPLSLVKQREVRKLLRGPEEGK
jgi:type IV pilus assembly protein PilP